MKLGTWNLEPRLRRGKLGTGHSGPSLAARTLVALIRVYQLTLARLLGPCCRFHPSCSQYWIEAIECHGLFRGIWLGIKRLGRCHPFHPGGVDPVPCSSRSMNGNVPLAERLLHPSGGDSK